MVGTIIITVISIVVIALGFILNANHIELLDVILVTFGTFIFTATAITAMEVSEQYKPTAIDVYRGKTTLKITYVDSVAVDTVVVFKEQ